MVSQQINREVLQLWAQTFDPGEDVWLPSVYPPIQQDGILFVGLNPSFPRMNGFKKILQGSPYSELDPTEFYHWRNRSNFDLDTAVEIARLAKERYDFFRPFRSFAEDLNTSWEHIDLFFYRVTDQGALKTRLAEPRLINFKAQQLELSRKLIEAARPRLIVVVNAYASGLFEAEFGPEFDEIRGCHLAEVDHHPIPVFLASMLTGQRAMDRYSLRRLKWHVRQVYPHSHNGA